MKKIIIIFSMCLFAFVISNNSYAQPEKENGLVIVTITGISCITDATGYVVELKMVGGGQTFTYTKPFVLNQADYQWDFSESAHYVCAYGDLLYYGESVKESGVVDCGYIDSEEPLHSYVDYPCQGGDD